jgi:hypothetical protein
MTHEMLFDLFILLTRPEKTIHNNKVYEKGKRGFIKGNPT